MNMHAQALMQLIVNRHTEAVRVFLQSGRHRRMVFDAAEERPLDVALDNRDEVACCLLIEAGVLATARSVPLLVRAVWSAAVMQSLLQVREDALSWPERINGDRQKRQALLTCLHAGGPQTLRALLRSGADPNAVVAGSHGFVPVLCLAVESAQQSGTANLALLLAAGADAQRRDDDGNTALHYALMALRCDARHFDATLALLVEAGLPLDAVNRHGMTALHLAAKTSNTHAIGALLDAGADRRLVSSRGYTPLQLAQTLGREDAVRALHGWCARQSVRNLFAQPRPQAS